MEWKEPLWDKFVTEATQRLDTPRLATDQESQSLSDERAEYLIRNRLSFMHFLGLSQSRAAAFPYPTAPVVWTGPESI